MGTESLLWQYQVSPVKLDTTIDGGRSNHIYCLSMFVVCMVLLLLVIDKAMCTRCVSNIQLCSRSLSCRYQAISITAPPSTRPSRPPSANPVTSPPSRSPTQSFNPSKAPSKQPTSVPTNLVHKSLALICSRFCLQ